MQATDAELPEAYKLGWIPFLGLAIWLDSRPLIPRPETEWWTEELVRTMSKWSGQIQTGDQRTFAKDSGEFQFLDLCTGSGAIGCAILKNCPHAQVYFGEIDLAHEPTIQKNIETNNLDTSRAHIKIGDLFEPFTGQQFDYIAANPPYIPQGRELPASVADYEPPLALRSGADGLDLMRRIAKELRAHLAPGGQAWIECDSPSIESASKLFEAEGFVVQICLDQYKAPRYLVISFLQ